MIASRPLPVSFAALLATSTVALFASGARAECSTDADCGKGLSCQVVAMSGCPAIACPAGQPCPMLPPCQPTEIKGCGPAPCNVDSDCGDGMVCFTDTSKNCAVPPTPSCPPNTKCDPPPQMDPTCTASTEKLCVPRYLLPCTSATDCGAGFDCVPDQSCWTSGGSGVGYADAGMAVPGSGGSDPMPVPTPTGSSGSGPAPAPTMGSPAPAPTMGDPAPAPTMGLPSSGCTLGPKNHCEAHNIDCTANTDCPTGWVCSEIGSTGIACGVKILPDGGTGPTMCDPPPPPVRKCTPPYYGIVGHGFNEGTVGIPQAGTATGAAGSGNGTVGGPTGAPMSGGAPKSANAAPASSNDSGSCQIGHGRSNAGAMLLAALGLVGLSRRRRTRAH